MPDIIKKLGEFKEKLGSQAGKTETAPAIFEVPKNIETTQPIAEKEGQVTEEKKEAAAPAQGNATIAVRVSKNPIVEKIEDVLEEDLESIYFQLPPDKQAEFRQEGEKTATQIELLLKETKVKIKKILELIMNWLRIIPGVNKFFLEQEAKIKTDKILTLKQDKGTKENQNKI